MPVLKLNRSSASFLECSSVYYLNHSIENTVNQYMKAVVYPMV